MASRSYDVISANDGYGPQTLRVLRPRIRRPGVAHNFLIVLPVEAGLGTTYGDGLATLQALDAQDQYNLTIVEPSFAIDPWYADNPRRCASAVRDLHDPGTGALGQAEPVDDRHTSRTG